jgi:hypothetical protein
MANNAIRQVASIGSDSARTWMIGLAQRSSCRTNATSTTPPPAPIGIAADGPPPVHAGRAYTGVVLLLIGLSGA